MQQLAALVAGAAGALPWLGRYGRSPIAYEESEAAAQAREAMILPSAEFVPLQLDPPQEAAEIQDIVIEVRRGAATITLHGPRSAAADCAIWLNGWLR
jgi:hypothetical protein